MVELGREGLNWLLILIAILLAYFGVLRPLLRTVIPPKEKPARDAQGEPGLGGEAGDEDEDGVVVSLSGGDEADSYESRLARARELARDDPKTVANLIKEWLGVAEEGRK